VGLPKAPLLPPLGFQDIQVYYPDQKVSGVTMPPSAESQESMHVHKPFFNEKYVPVPAIDFSKNVTAAINYEVSLVDEFVASQRKRRRRTNSTTTDAEALPLNTKTSNTENSTPNADRDRHTVNKTNTFVQTPPSKEILNDCKKSRSKEQTRRSARDKGKRELTLARVRVRYDMQLVPVVHRNRKFLQSFPAWWKTPEPKLARRLSSRLTTEATEAVSCRLCQTPTALATNTPFLENSSVIWIPSKRSEWEDTVSEMTAVCTSGALRRHVMTQGRASTSKPFHAPLSRDYIRDRVDIDDPLLGYQLRHKEGGWLQGFVMFTNFTTWTHGFRWDSLHSKSGIPAFCNTTNSASMNPQFVDADGSLALELESMERSGDPLREGIVFPQLAEIGLVGGLGCGEYLLRMALDHIRTKGQYKYVVLQATDSSKSFYERFGFIRVGAVCMYMGQDASKQADNELVGYRHWTHANESQTSLHLHGGPSYMMCLKLPTGITQCCSGCRLPNSLQKRPSFLEAMLSLQVLRKPAITSLGGSSTLTTTTPKLSRKNSDSASADDASHSEVKKTLGRRPTTPHHRRKSNTPSKEGPSSVTKRSYDSDAPSQDPSKKKRKADGTTEKISRDRLLSAPKGGVSLSYAQKQYQSVWLAVPPTEPKVGRPPPKPRSQGTGASDGDNAKANQNILGAGSKIKFKIAIVDGKERLYHSVRGIDGRFVRIYADEGSFASTIAPNLMPQAVKAAASKQEIKFEPKDAERTKTSNPRPKPVDTPLPPPSVPLMPHPSGKPQPIEKSSLKKQKVRSYPRSRVHYFNRVVKAVKAGPSPTYYFVLHYDEDRKWIRIVPIEPKGSLTGKCEGRARYQAVLADTDENLISASINDFQVVPASMIMKTPLVSQEAWDVNDRDTPV
jgi:hypothetical protein